MPVPFTPETLPISQINWESHVTMIGKANAALAKFEGVLYGIANPEIFISPLRTKEAVLSSKMEGTQASFTDVLRFDAGELELNLNDGHEVTDDYTEVINYRNALLFAEKNLSSKPFHLNLLLKMHEILLDSARGRQKGRGRFRTLQNWIGPDGCSMDEALFVPPRPVEIMDHLSHWEKYYHMEDKDPLVQLAVIHAQFEIIHPFLAGNGRIGRILIPLFLYEKKLLSRPVFYLSAYLEAHTSEYTSKLRDLGSPGAWDQWISYFLTAILHQADRNREIARGILELYGKLKASVMKKTRSSYAVAALDFVFEHPVFLQSWLVEDSRMPTPATVGNIIKQFVDEGILQVSRPGSGRRSTVLVAPALLDACDPESKAQAPA